MSSYRLKHIEFLGRQTSILCQNENGPCPLLAICNALLLRSQIHIHADVAEVSLSELITLVANRLVEANAAGGDSERAANQAHALHDAIDLLPSLGRGLDVNVRFTSCAGFEYTRECGVFDLLDLSLLHGWLVDPQEREVQHAIGERSYNQLIEMVVEARSAAAATAPRDDLKRAAKADDGASASLKEESDARGDAGAASKSDGADAEDDAAALTAALALSLGGGEEGGTSAAGAKAAGGVEDADGKASADDGDGAKGSKVAADEQAADAKAADDKATDAKAADAKTADAKAPAAAAADDDEATRLATVRAEGQLVDAWLSQTGAQLTYYGLLQLHTALRESELAVFFRNNHFSTIFKRNGELYLLITDLGYQHEAGVVWCAPRVDLARRACSRAPRTPRVSPSPRALRALTSAPLFSRARVFREKLDPLNGQVFKGFTPRWMMPAKVRNPN